MAAQHTLNASLMQACRSSEVSAVAVELKNAIVSASAIGADVFIERADVFIERIEFRLPGTCMDAIGSDSLPEAGEGAW
jgi:hypothetical protein